MMASHACVQAFDRRPSAKERRAFFRARRAERMYVLQLRRIARQIGIIVHAFDPNDQLGIAQMTKVLEGYSKTIEPWARAVGTAMVKDVANRDYRAWVESTQDAGRALRLEIQSAPTGLVMQQKIAEQVHYITSLPLDAAQRVQKLATEALITGTRAAEISKEIMRQGEVSRSRADLIARTEVGRTAATLTQARAQYIGSEGYIWRAVMDSATRKRHRQLDGRFFTWDNPPVSGENGERSLPGAIYNCRCAVEPIIPTF